MAIRHQLAFASGLTNRCLGRTELLCVSLLALGTLPASISMAQANGVRQFVQTILRTDPLMDDNCTASAQLCREVLLREYRRGRVRSRVFLDGVAIATEVELIVAASGGDQSACRSAHDVHIERLSEVSRRITALLGQPDCELHNLREVEYRRAMALARRAEDMGDESLADFHYRRAVSAAEQMANAVEGVSPRSARIASLVVARRYVRDAYAALAADDTAGRMAFSAAIDSHCQAVSDLSSLGSADSAARYLMRYEEAEARAARFMQRNATKSALVLWREMVAVPPDDGDTWTLLRATDAQMHLGQLNDEPDIVAAARRERSRLFREHLHEVLKDEQTAECDLVSAACHYVLAWLQLHSEPAAESARWPP